MYWNTALKFFKVVIYFLKVAIIIIGIKLVGLNGYTHKLH